MTDSELREFFAKKRFTQADQLVIVEQWNRIRTDVPKIGKNHVRTPCRLRQVVSSMRKYLAASENIVT